MSTGTLQCAHCVLQITEIFYQKYIWLACLLNTYQKMLCLYCFRNPNNKKIFKLNWVRIFLSLKIQPPSNTPQFVLFVLDPEAGICPSCCASRLFFVSFAWITSIINLPPLRHTGGYVGRWVVEVVIGDRGSLSSSQYYELECNQTTW